MMRLSRVFIVSMCLFFSGPSIGQDAVNASDKSAISSVSNPSNSFSNYKAAMQDLLKKMQGNASLTA